jgi:hypothetical protein
MARSLRPTPRQATIFINKLEAARRQLDAAIRMTFANEDELAIHTVAAAAYRILRDMLHKRGRHDLEELIRFGFYTMAKNFLEGKIEKDSLEKSQLYHLVSRIADTMKVHGNKLTVDNMPIFVNEASKKAHWQAMSKVSGFLKHADRLPEAIISLADVDNTALIMYACATFGVVSHALTPEMVIFNQYVAATTGITREQFSGNQRRIVDYLERLSPSRRRRACQKFIRVSKKGDLHQ